MKKINLLLIFSIFFFVFTSCATTVETVNLDSLFVLNENEGFILMRIVNPNAGKVVDNFYYSNGKEAKNKKALRLNSDLQIKRAPGSVWTFTVKNREAPEQYVMLKAKKGSYGIIQVGNNSEYFNPYIFKVEAGVVNYAGDIKLDIVTGRVLVYRDIKDYYDLSVVDKFDEIVELRKSLDFLSVYSEYEFVDQSKNIEPMKPLFCRVIRDN